MRRASLLICFAFLPLACTSQALDVGGSGSSNPNDPEVCSADDGERTVLVEEPYITDFAIDRTHLYYIVESLDASSPVEGTIKRVPLAGGTAEVIARSSPTYEIAVAGDWVYWIASASPENGPYPRLFRVAKTGGLPEAITSAPDVPRGNFVVDARSNLYLMDDPPRSKLTRVAPDGTRTTIVSSDGTTASITAYTVANDNVFWSTIQRLDDAAVGLTVLTKPLDGGSERTIYGPIAQSSPTKQDNVAVGVIPSFAVGPVSSDGVYLLSNNAIQLLPKDGGEPTTMISRPNATIRPFPIVKSALVDQDQLFWSMTNQEGGGNVMRLVKGGEPETLAYDLRDPQRIRVNHCNVFWNSGILGQGYSIYRRAR